MKTGIISDIHSNIVALKACIEYMEAISCDEYLYDLLTKAYCDFLYKDGVKRISDGALVAITLMIAESNSQHAIIGSGGYMPEDVMDVFAIMQDERWDIERIITDVFPWEKLPDAIEKAADSQNAFNVVIQY